MNSVPGLVMSRLPKELFRVRTEDGHEVVAHVWIEKKVQVSRLLEGDQVRLEISPTDRSRGRIVGRGLHVSAETNGGRK